MKKLNLQENSKIIGGASIGRCQAMEARYINRGGDRLLQRILKNCSQYQE
tara:strand:- start:7422 stop:7571 length:150 start_codon:yes stop_codon:yes gene_type:complete